MPRTPAGRSAEIDFYRTHAAAQRGAARRDAAAVLSIVSACVLTLAVALAMVMLLSSPILRAPNHAVMARSIAAPVR